MFFTTHKKEKRVVRYPNFSMTVKVYAYFSSKIINRIPFCYQKFPSLDINYIAILLKRHRLQRQCVGIVWLLTHTHTQEL